MNQKPIVYWLFCKVIDNFGDIGLCWRLARQLCSEYGAQVCLWVDDLASFQKICPEVSFKTTSQMIDGIRIEHWLTQHDSLVSKLDGVSPDVLIEAFACDLPQNLQQWAATRSLVWLNLEYLSAEHWVESMHLMPSLQAQGGSKIFFFPGFTEKTGGLLREKKLARQRRFFLHSESAQAQFLQALSVPVRQTGRYTVFIFSYESPALLSWLKTWQALQLPVDVWLAPSRNMNSLKALFSAGFSEKEQLRLGSVRVNVLPMVSQQQFDQILWLADINIVRGEDSLVRAHWAHKPFFWHIYPQEDKAHLPKLNAFWQQIYPLYEGCRQEAHRALSLELNQTVSLNEAERAQYWQMLFSDYDLWQSEHKKWTEKQQGMKSLAENLVKLVKTSLK